jgi:Zn-dependent M28 family amino/carboxypeptidase
MRLVAATPTSKPLPDEFKTALDSVSSDDLRDVVKSIAVPRVFGTPENQAIRRVLIDLFSSHLGTGSVIAVDEAGNLVAGDPRRAKILLGAHYDAVPGTPGADDNASAVAVLLAAARAIGQHEEVCYVAFDGEECGFVGSRALVKGLGRNRLEQVHVLEMVGFTSTVPNSQKNPIPMIPAPTVGDFLGLVGTDRSRYILDHVLACAGHAVIPVYGLYLPNMPLSAMQTTVPHTFRSDHAPFWEAGIPALMWTDTAEFRNPNYHRPTDTPETLDYAFIAEVAKLLAHAVLSSLDGPRT